MADFTFNIAKGMVAYYATLPGANDALVAVPIESSGVETDAVLKDADTLAAVLAGATNEQTTMGRKTLTSVTSAVDDTDDAREVGSANLSWTAASGPALAAIVICYDPDTTAGTDADLIPLTKHDFPVTPNGGDIVAQVGANGFFRAL